MCYQMTLIPNALSPSVQKTVTVTLTGSAVGTTVEAWCAHLQVSTNSTTSLPSSLLPRCQNEASYETISHENTFCLQVHFLANQTQFCIKCFACKRTRFETEAQDNSEIVYQ